MTRLPAIFYLPCTRHMRAHVRHVLCTRSARVFHALRTILHVCTSRRTSNPLAKVKQFCNILRSTGIPQPENNDNKFCFVLLTFTARYSRKVYIHTRAYPLSFYRNFLQSFTNLLQVAFSLPGAAKTAKKDASPQNRANSA